MGVLNICIVGDSDRENAARSVWEVPRATPERVFPTFWRGSKSGPASPPAPGSLQVWRDASVAMRSSASFSSERRVQLSTVSLCLVVGSPRRLLGVKNRGALFRFFPAPSTMSLAYIVSNLTVSYDGRIS
jgi:hypothetical protein